MIDFPVQSSYNIQDTSFNPIEISSNKTGAESVGAGSADFGTHFKQALDHVNELQGEASDLRADYETGAVTDLGSVMIASQKSSLAFQGLMQVRNKVVSAYETVFNMPV